MQKLLLVLLAIVMLSASQSVEATPVLPTSYNMPNGFGQANGGSFNYWDRFYSGGGATTTDGVPLSGGLGDLTDGVIASSNWNVVENAAGTGPYVGWLNINPTITFNFAATQQFQSVRIYFDDANGAGAVSAPLNVIINGSTFPVTDPAGSAPFFVDFNIRSLNTNQLTIQLTRNNLWVFASEFTFDAVTTTKVPEAASLLLFGVGFAVIWGWRRRKS